MATLARVDATTLQKRLGELHRMVGGDARGMLRTEMSHLIEDLANATTKPAKQGRRITRDFRVAFRPARDGAASPNLRELYKTLDSFGKTGRRLPLVVRVYYAERKRHQQRIGFLAAGWLGGGNPMRAKAPPAALNQPVKGTFQIIDTPRHYLLVATNKVPFARHMRGLTIIIQKAVNRRAGSIKKNMALIAAGVKRYQTRV